MTKREKLQEATIKALTRSSKLSETSSDKSSKNRYELTYFLNTATRERRPETYDDIKNDWTVETFEAANDIEASKIAFGIVREIEDEEDLNDYAPDVGELWNIETDDWGDGSFIAMKLVNLTTNKVLFDAGYTLESFAAEYGVEDDEDDEY